MSTEPNVEPIYAFDVFKDGRVKKLSSLDVSSPMSDNLAYRWVHLDVAHEATRAWVSRHIDPIIAHSMTIEGTRPRAVQHDNGILLNLRGVNLNPDSEPEDMVSIRLWIEDNIIISVRSRRLMAVLGIRESIEAGNPPATIGAFIAQLSTSLIVRMDNVISDLSDKIDELEEISLEKPEGLRTSLAKLRRMTIIYVATSRHNRKL